MCALVPDKTTLGTRDLLVPNVPDTLRLKAFGTPQLVGVLRAAISSLMVGLKFLFIKWQSLDLQLPGTIAFRSFSAVCDLTTLLEAILGKWTSVVWAAQLSFLLLRVLSFSILVV